MDWREFNHAALHRLWQSLLEQSQSLADADAWLAKYGRPPTDPLRVEVLSAWRHIVCLADQVRDAMREFAPYRPLVDPWKNSGLSAHLRPDFKARGVTEHKEPT